MNVHIRLCFSIILLYFLLRQYGTGVYMKNVKHVVEWLLLIKDGMADSTSHVEVSHYGCFTVNMIVPWLI
jgi:hypothetical protein